jgi:hypothetical protein
MSFVFNEVFVVADFGADEMVLQVRGEYAPAACCALCRA